MDFVAKLIYVMDYGVKNTELILIKKKQKNLLKNMLK